VKDSSELSPFQFLPPPWSRRLWRYLRLKFVHKKLGCESLIPVLLPSLQQQGETLSLLKLLGNLIPIPRRLHFRIC